MNVRQIMRFIPSSMTMEPSTSIPICSRHPVIYKNESSFNEVIQMYCNEILQCVTFSNLEVSFVNYITSVVEPVGWKAVWRSMNESTNFGVEYDFVVEVVNVSLEKLEADVNIKSVIIPDSADLHMAITQSQLKMDYCYTVPLIELYTISEGDDEFYERTAVAIEYARLFYKELLRPWDGEDEDTVYSEEVLAPRLQLYFEMKTNIVPKAMISKIREMLKEGWQIQRNLNSLYTEMNVSDSDSELNVDDVAESVALRTKLGQLQKKLELLENPVIRSFVMKKYVPYKSRKQRKFIPVTYIIAKEFKFEMIANLQLEASTTLEFNNNPENAFKCSSSGDEILIFPGFYQCDSLGWLEGDISVKGIGPPEQIVLEATGNSEVFLNCCAPLITLQNLTLRATSGLLSTVVVHHGKLCLQNSILDSNGAETGLLLLGGADVSLDGCEICNSRDDGVQLRLLSGIHLKSSKISSCGGNGIQIDFAEGVVEGVTELHIFDSYIVNNEGYAIFLSNAPMASTSLEKTNGDISILSLFPCISHKIENSVMGNNIHPYIGMSSCSKISSYNTLTYNGVSAAEDLECSNLSELLNDVNISDIML